ncbi:MAG TPA: hypothetical protein VM098_01730 [Phycisphaerae bacterium]|nr:hypothetical protein [Phycisphaerae bacterium]
METHKIVVRFLNGRVTKGHTTNFSPTAPHFVLTPVDTHPSPRPELVELNMLKAVFFVRDFAGNRAYHDKKDFVSGQPYKGHKVQVEFADGEVMMGYTPNYDCSLLGFFIFPADPDSNALRVFVVNSSVKSVRLL